MSKVRSYRMDGPERTSLIDGESVTRDILNDLIAYRTSTPLNDCTGSLKKRIRKLSDKIKIDSGVKDKSEDLLANAQALKGVIHALYLHAETEEQHVLYAVCLFTYVAELCKNVQVGSHELIADKVIVVLKSTVKGRIAMSLFRRMNAREKTKTILKKVALLAIITAGVLWFVKKR